MDELHARSSLELLTRQAMQLADNELSFVVHYWGIEPRHYDNPLHKHSFYEICYVMEGDGQYFERDQLFELRKDTLFLSRPGIPHQILSDTGMFLLFVAFEIDSIRSLKAAISSYERLSAAANFLIPDAGASKAALIWKALVSPSDPFHPTTTVLTRCLAHTLLLSFSSAFCESFGDASKLLPSKRSAHSVNKANLFIRDNLSPNLTVEDVANYMHMSSRHLTRLFKQECQMSCIDMIQREKISLAVRLLETSELPISEIAEKAGFSSVHYFTRAFTKMIGTPPGQYRKR